MKDFETRRQEYYDKLHGDTIESNICNQIISNPNNDINIQEMMLIPRTEKELEFVEAIIKYFSIVIKIVNGECEDIVELDESIIYSIVIDMVNALKNNEKEAINNIRSFVNNINSPKAYARLIYDYYNIPDIDSLFAKEYIANKCDFDLYDEIDSSRLDLYIKKVLIMHNSKDYKIIDFNIESVENNPKVDFFINVSNELVKVFKERNNKNRTR